MTHTSAIIMESVNARRRVLYNLLILIKTAVEISSLALMDFCCAFWVWCGLVLEVFFFFLTGSFFRCVNATGS